ncbi:MAG: transposase, partial [Deltaproteobacteria bacterium]|nr:transposase [Deltaproteobacteria bacterium]
MKEREFNKLSHTIYEYIYHIVFCPKYRKRILQDDIAEYIKQLKFHRNYAFYTHATMRRRVSTKDFRESLPSLSQTAEK